MESDFIRWLRTQIPDDPAVRVGIGDDAAVLNWPAASPCVLTTDMLMDGVDFQLGECEPRRAGRKALAVNLSDLAAMAARPVAALVSLALPRRGGATLGRELYAGLLPLAREYSTPIVGGDTNSWDGPLVLSVTAVGALEAGSAWCRSGARPGDQLLVTGQVGGSILGHHFDFSPRVFEALELRRRYQIHAATDVSDGLTWDLLHLAEESGCGAELQLAQVPVAPAAHQLAHRGSGKSPLDHALGDGEDFELLLAVPAEEASRLLAEQPLAVPLTRIGQFVSDRGLWQVLPSGERQPLAASGYQHEFLP